MLYYDEKKYEKCISDETILKIESEMGIKCLFGGAFSTCVYGIDNNASDFDFYLLYDKRDTAAEAFRYFDKETLIDIYMLDWNYVNRSSSLYLESIAKYPSILHRAGGREHRMNFQRADFTSQVIFEILYSDYVWDSGFLLDNIDGILRSLSYVGILDYYFTRAWGNLHQELVKEEGRAVKYLMAFLGYACMRWLTEYKTIPNMNIHFMFQQYLPEHFKGFFSDILKRQKDVNVERDFRMHSFDVGTHNLFQVDAKEMDVSNALTEKKEALVEKNEDVNTWLGQELKKLADLLPIIASSPDRICVHGGNMSFLFKHYETFSTDERE